MYELQTFPENTPTMFSAHTLLKHDYFLPHWHENLEILHMLKGHGKFSFGTEEILAVPGDTVVVNSGALHQICALDDKIVYYCLIISKEFLHQSGIDISEILIKSKLTDAAIADLCKQTNRSREEKKPFYQLEITGNALKIVSLLACRYQNISEIQLLGKESPKTKTVKRALEFMRQNYNKNISLDDVALYLGFNKSYLCRVFKEMTGMTAIQILNTIKCDEAKRLLLTKNYTISEAAERCGFENLSYFARTYKNIIGCPPSKTKIR